MRLMRPFALLILAGAPLMAQTRGVPVQEITDPGAPSAGYGTCWFDVTSHVFSCRNSSNVLFTGQPASALWPVSCTTPGASWLTCTVVASGGASAVSIAPTTAQTSHQVIGTCGTATSFGPCTLTQGDLPTTLLASGAALPSSPSSNQLFVLTTAADATHCVASAGSASSLCMWNGSSWQKP